MPLTNADLLKFKAALCAAEKSPATVQKYCREAEKFARWLENRPLTREAALAYKAELSRTRAPAGVNGAVAALNKLFAVLNLPDCKLKAAKIQRPLFRDESKELTRAEYARLVSTANQKHNARLALLLQTICSAGLRVSELQFVTAEAVHLGRAEVTNKGKTRTVFLPTKLTRLLKKYARAQKISTGPIFVTKTGKPLDRSNIWRSMKALCKEAHVSEKKVFPHNLRHLFARTFYAVEKDIVRLADILGHSSINTTRIYTLESGREHRRRLDKLGLVG